MVGGSTAALVDAKHAISSRLLLTRAMIVVTTFILLSCSPAASCSRSGPCWATPSPSGPRWGRRSIFQNGNLASVLGFTPTPTNTAMPVPLFCIAFGLFMDYEVFLMSRSRSCTTPTRPLSRPSPPAWPGPGGSSRPRPLCSMSASSPSARAGRASSSFFGLGTGLAILIDATLVRGVLVPAFMRAFGERSWYAAPLLRRWHERIGVTSTTLRRPLGVSTSAAGRATQARAAAGSVSPGS